MEKVMTYAPVIIPTFSRYEHFKNCIESLKKNPLARFTEVYIGLDYTDDPRFTAGNLKIKKYIENGIDGFKKVNVYIREKNFGAEKNCENLKNEVEKKYDRYIFSEDDNIFSPCFLEYMNKTLEFSKSDESILAVCGYSFPVVWKDTQGYGVIKHKSFFWAWGYGAFFDRIHKFEKVMTETYFVEKYKDKKARKALKKFSETDYCYLVNLAYKKRMFNHDVAKTLYMFFEDCYCVIPTLSLVKNCGWDGSGIHCNKDFLNLSEQVISDKDKFDADLNGVYLYHDMENEKMVNEFYKPPFMMKFKAFIKRLLMLFRK